MIAALQELIPEPWPRSAELWRDWLPGRPFPRLSKPCETPLPLAPMLLLALVAAVALATSACSSSSVSGDAIVVNGVGLSKPTSRSSLDLIQADANYAKKARHRQPGSGHRPHR